MRNKKIGLSILWAVIGVILFCIGGAAMILEWFPALRALPGILIGAGCGIFGHNIGTVIQIEAMKKNPKEARRIGIEQRDERNLSINNTAKGRAYDAMVYIYGVVILICALLEINVIVVLLLVGAYLLVQGIRVYHFYKLSMEG